MSAKHIKLIVNTRSAQIGPSTTGNWQFLAGNRRSTSRIYDYEPISSTHLTGEIPSGDTRCTNGAKQ